jgi:pyridoxamine 5'-phosphate oxidase
MTDYTRNPPLTEADLDADPAVQCERWLADAAAAGAIEPTALTLATADAAGQPSARMVLYKGMHAGGPTFYTNYESRKAAELAANPQVALLFWWGVLERQVRIEGTAAKVAPALSDQYFHSRARRSQLSAFTSRQSRVVGTRAELEARVAQTAARFEGQEVPCPEYWGGYRVEPVRWEFWQGRADRLHDRMVYVRAAGGWRMERLEP